MARNKNTPGTGDRGDVPESLVGKLMKATRAAQEAKEECARLRKEIEDLKKSRKEPEPPAPPAPAPAKEEPPKKTTPDWWHG